MTRTIHITLAALLVLAVGAIAGVGRPEPAGGADTARAEGIIVTGTGRVETVPDEAEFSFGISTKGATAREALRANSVEMRQLIAALKAAGADARDIKTQDVSVSPNYGGGPQPTGFAAQNTVSVQIHQLAQAGALVDAASEAGANEIYGPTLSRGNRAELEAKALERAFANAHERAQALARAAGVELGRVTAIVEAPAGGPAPYYSAARLAQKADAPIEPGSEEIQASVTVTFALGG